MTLLTANLNLQLETCGKCGGTCGMPADFMRERLDKGGDWYCPFCRTSWCYRETNLTKERRLREQAERRAVRAERRADTNASLMETERRRAAGYKGVITRTKRRIARGQCPCCKADFSDLKAHMETAHPGFEAEE